MMTFGERPTVAVILSIIGGALMLLGGSMALMMLTYHDEDSWNDGWIRRNDGWLQAHDEWPKLPVWLNERPYARKPGVGSSGDNRRSDDQRSPVAEQYMGNHSISLLYNQLPRNGELPDRSSLGNSWRGSSIKLETKAQNSVVLTRINSARVFLKKLEKSDLLHDCYSILLQNNGLSHCFSLSALNIREKKVFQWFEK